MLALRALALYMVLRLPDILAELIPVAALLAGLLSFAELARHSELTAIYAGGMSKVRLAVAFLPVVVLIGAFQLLIEDQARPAAMRELRAWGVGDYNTSDEPAATWLRRGSEILRIQRIDPGQAELRGVTIFQRDADGNLTAKIEAARAVAEGDAWMLYDVALSKVGSTVVETAARLPWSGDLAPGDLDVLITNPPDMPLLDLLRVLRHPELGSQPAYRYETSLHERLAGPLTTAMLLFLTVALARPPHGRGTQTALIAVGIGGGFLLWTFDGLVSNFGDLGLVPPIAGGLGAGGRDRRDRRLDRPARPWLQKSDRTADCARGRRPLKRAKATVCENAGVSVPQLRFASRTGGGSFSSRAERRAPGIWRHARGAALEGPRRSGVDVASRSGRATSSGPRGLGPTTPVEVEQAIEHSGESPYRNGCTL